MTKNPFINALAALAYIVLIVTAVFYSPKFIDQQATIITPIMMLSLFVFSAAAMAYVFMYQPLQLFLDGEKKKGLDLFLKTLGIFGICAVAFVTIGFYVVLHAAKPGAVIETPQTAQ